MILLRSEAVLARLDPAHGGEVLDLVDLRTGRQLLGRPPFASLPPLGGDLDEDTWTARYRGGWQTVLPNAGNPCSVGGDRHGFHGRASNDPWTVVEAAPAAATIAWSGHGLDVRRRWQAAAATLRVETEVRATGARAPFVAVEHVAAGLELLDPAVELELPGGATAYELDETTGPVRTPEWARPWPEIGLAAGGAERGPAWRLATPRARLYALTGLDGRAVLRNRDRGQSLTLRWDAQVMPHAWVWHDVRGTGGIWRHANEVLTFEPASVAHSLGLERAVAEGQAEWVEPGTSVSWWVEVEPGG